MTHFNIEDKTYQDPIIFKLNLQRGICFNPGMIGFIELCALFASIRLTLLSESISLLFTSPLW